MERDGRLASEIQKSRLGLSVFVAPEESLNGRKLDGQDSVFLPLPHPLRGQVIILRAFMMHDKDTVGPILGGIILLLTLF